MYSDNYRSGGRYSNSRGNSHRGRGGFGDSWSRYDDEYEQNPPFQDNYQRWQGNGYRGNGQSRGTFFNQRSGRGGYRGGPNNHQQGRRGGYQNYHDNRGRYSQRNQSFGRGRHQRRPNNNNQQFGGGNQGYSDPPSNRQMTNELPSGLSWNCDLSGHTNRVTCIEFGSESGKLFSGGADGVVRQWNEESGQVDHTATYDGEISAMLVTGNYLFVGIHCKEAGNGNPSMGSGDIHVYNLSMQTEQKFMAHIGRMTTLHAVNDVLFSAGEDKIIKAWKFNSDTSLFEPGGAFGPEHGGHQAAVNCLVTYADFLFSGDIRGMIKVWDLQSGNLVHTLPRAHNASISSMIVYQGSLITGSQDQSISVWNLNADRQTSVVIQTPPRYHEETRGSNGYPTGVISLLITTDGSDSDVLLTGLASGEVLLNDLPSFSLKGKIREMLEPKALASIPSHCLFIGQRTGDVKIYRWENSGTMDDNAMDTTSSSSFM